MASGKTLELAAFSRQMSYRQVAPLESPSRDRSLPGKKRIRARKQANRKEVGLSENPRGAE